MSNFLVLFGGDNKKSFHQTVTHEITSQLHLHSHPFLLESIKTEEPPRHQLG